MRREDTLPEHESSRVLLKSNQKRQLRVTNTDTQPDGALELLVSDSHYDEAYTNMFVLTADNCTEHLNVFFNGVSVKMELDTGASLSMINEENTPHSIPSNLLSKSRGTTQVT